MTGIEPAYVDVVDVLLNGAYYTVEAELPALIEHGDGGAIVIMSSAAGLNNMCPRHIKCVGSQEV